jgi:hypothetical protein
VSDAVSLKSSLRYYSIPLGASRVRFFDEISYVRWRKTWLFTDPYEHASMFETAADTCRA